MQLNTPVCKMVSPASSQSQLGYWRTSKQRGKRKRRQLYFPLFSFFSFFIYYYYYWTLEFPLHSSLIPVGAGNAPLPTTINIIRTGPLKRTTATFLFRAGLFSLSASLSSDLNEVNIAFLEDICACDLVYGVCCEVIRRFVVKQEEEYSIWRFWRLAYQWQLVYEINDIYDSY